MFCASITQLSLSKLRFKIEIEEKLNFNDYLFVDLQVTRRGVFCWMGPAATFKSTLRFRVQPIRRPSVTEPNRTMKTANLQRSIGMVTFLL